MVVKGMSWGFIIFMGVAFVAILYAFYRIAADKRLDFQEPIPIRRKGKRGG